MTEAVPGPQGAAVAALDQLVRLGKLSQEDGVRAVSLAKETGTALPTILDRLGLVPRTDVLSALATACDLPYFAELPPNDALSKHPRLSISFLKQRHVLPVLGDDGQWMFLLSDPDDRTLIKALRLATGAAPRLAIAGEREIDAALAEIELQDVRQQGGQPVSTTLSDAEHLQELANNSPTVSFVDGVFETAIQRGATDIHIEPGERAGRLRLRVDGVLIEHGAVPSELYPGVVSRLKILAGMDVAERRLPQDGRISHRGGGTSFDVRAATLPTVFGEAMALRLLRNGSRAMSLEALGLPEPVHASLATGLAHRNGIILVTGPTGSGKTTTLHAVLDSINSGSEKIMTVENPVEIRVPGLIQIEARPEIGLSFAAGLRSILRHDPDIIMVGEIRDSETASIAIQAALTGHLVLSTLHTNDAAASATRLVDMGVDPFLLRATLRLAIAQRLVRKLCLNCAEPVQADPNQLALLGRWGQGLQTPSLTLKRPIGCAHCSKTGYRGRQAIFECADPQDLAGEITGQKRGGGQSGMFGHGLALAIAGITTIDEVLRVVEGASA